VCTAGAAQPQRNWPLLMHRYQCIASTNALRLLLLSRSAGRFCSTTAACASTWARSHIRDPTARRRCLSCRCFLVGAFLSVLFLSGAFLFGVFLVRCPSCCAATAPALTRWSCGAVQGGAAGAGKGKDGKTTLADFVAAHMGAGAGELLGARQPSYVFDSAVLHQVGG
jgi:hypothetical protein